MAGLTLLFMLFNIRSCLPATTTCVTFLFIIVFSLLAVVFTVLAFGFTILCGEIDRQHAREPGVIQWFAVPYCVNATQDIFTKLNDTVGDGEKTNAAEFCRQISKFCDPNPVYDALNAPTIVFICNVTNTTAASKCPTFQTAYDLMLNSVAKTGSNACSGNPSCNMTSCGTECDITEVRYGFGNATKILHFALQAVQAYEIVAPLLDCNTIVDHVLAAFDACHKARDGMTEVGWAFIVSDMLFISTIFILFRGQKVFFSYSMDNVRDWDIEAEEQNLEGGVPAKNLEMKTVTESSPASRMDKPR
jgi:hypothetical protein